MMEAAAPEAGSPNVVEGKKRPEEALLPTYGIGLAAKGYSGQHGSAAQNNLTIYCVKVRLMDAIGLC